MSGFGNPLSVLLPRVVHVADACIRIIKSWFISFEHFNKPSTISELVRTCNSNARRRASCVRLGESCTFRNNHPNSMYTSVHDGSSLIASFRAASTSSRSSLIDGLENSRFPHKQFCRHTYTCLARWQLMARNRYRSLGSVEAKSLS